MSKYLEELDRRKPNDDMPPINLGTYDNPLLWNYLDPYGAERGHQQRPLSISRSKCELYQVPHDMRDACVHRFLPWRVCNKNVRPGVFGTASGCHEFIEAYLLCKVSELYRHQLLKSKWIEYTKHYSDADKHFFTNHSALNNWTLQTTAMYWVVVASMRLYGRDDRDPRNRLMNREPNRSLMRAEFSPSNFERGLHTMAYGHKLIDDELIEKELPMFPLPEASRPV